MPNPYPCPYCKRPILAAVQPSFHSLSFDKRKRRFFDPEVCERGGWVLQKADAKTDTGIPYTEFFYREARKGDTRQRKLHTCKDNQ